MAHLKQLKFTALPRGGNPTLARREKLIARLQEQRQLLQDPSYVRVTQRWTGKGDERRQVERRQPVHPWWRQDGSGVVFSVRYGFRPLEFEKGKSGIAAASIEKLPGVIDTLVAAVGDGELDEAIARNAQQGATRPKPKRAA
jgi:hypothetical protein